MTAMLVLEDAKKAVRELTETRSMRTSRAISKILYQNGVLTQAGEQHASELIKYATKFIEENYSLVISQEKEDFIRAYNAVSSCMGGKGERMAQFYLLHKEEGYAIAYLQNKSGEIVARCITNIEDKTFCHKQYGEEHYLLKAMLEVAGYTVTTELRLFNSAIARVRHVPVRYEKEQKHLIEFSRSIKYITVDQLYRQFDYLREAIPPMNTKEEFESAVRRAYTGIIERHKKLNPASLRLYNYRIIQVYESWGSFIAQLQVFYVTSFVGRCPEEFETPVYPTFTDEFPRHLPSIDFYYDPKTENLPKEELFEMCAEYIVWPQKQTEDPYAHLQWWEGADDKDFFPRARKGKAKHKLK
jgi:hypothetical protein